MLLKGREAQAFLRKPDPKAMGLLISGDDVMRVARARADVARAITGPEGEAEMRLTRIPAADLRKDPALLADATRAAGFFPGARCVVVEDATDGLSDTISAALKGWQAGDAQVIVTAGNLTPKSALRKYFEGHPAAFAITLYDEPPGAEEIARLVADAGLRLTSEAKQELGDLARSLDPGDFRQTVEKLGLYMHGAQAEATPADIAAVAPGSHEADVDSLCEAAMDRAEGKLADLSRRLAAQGTGPVAIVIALNRYVRNLHQMAVDPAGAKYLRVSGGFRRKDAMMRQANQWGAPLLGEVLGQVVDTDLQLRSADSAPQKALVERLLIRIVRMRRR